MNPWINYHHLYYFMTIAEMGSVSKAAEKLRLGQPTLSAQLRQFEDALGIQLFERQHKKLILSEQGKLALEYARGIFKMGAEMYDALHDRLKPAKMSVQLGALDSVPKEIMFELTRAAFAIAPCSIQLVEAKWDELIREVASHRIDLAITGFLPGAEAAKGLYHRVLVKKPVSIYGAPKWKALKKDFPESLSDHPFVLPTYDSQLRYGMEHWLKLKDLRVDVIAETQDTALNKLMAVNGLALIPAASHTVAAQVAEGGLIEIGPVQSLFEELYLIAAHRKIENPIAANLMKTFTLH